MNLLCAEPVNLKIQNIKTKKLLQTISYPVPHFKKTDSWWWILAPQSIYCGLQFTKNCKTTCPKVGNEISNTVHVHCILHLLKARTTMDNIFLSHSYILVFPPKSLFSITLILICITLSHHTVRKSFLFPLQCIVLQEKCHFSHLKIQLFQAKQKNGHT